METAIDYLTLKHDWKVSSDPRTYSDYPNNYGLRNFTVNGFNYDADSGGYHRAFDLYNNKTNEVPSVTHGTVVRATKKGAFGGEVVIKDYNGYYWVYGHLQVNHIKVKKGDKIKQGHIIGLQGNSNYYNKPMNAHLHLQLLAPGSNITKGKWYVEGLQIDRYNINNGDYSPIKPKAKDIPTVKIRQQLSYNNNYYPGKSSCKYITLHETANKQRGANAASHANFIDNGAEETWHYTVDDKEAVQSFHDTTRCWHAGDGNGPGNMESIGIEVCVNSDGNFKKALQNAASLVKILMERHNVPISRVVQHNHWSGKHCPTQLREGSKGVNWKQFIDMVKTQKAGQTAQQQNIAIVSKPAPTQGEWQQNKYGTWWKKEQETFYNGNEGIEARKVGPYTHLPSAGILAAGAPGIKYEEVMLADGHVWIGYILYDGTWEYLPIRTWNGVAPGTPGYAVGPLWGTIK